MHDRGGVRRPFRPEGQRVGFQRQQSAVRALDLELIELAAVQAGQEQLPHAGLDALAHRVAAAVPVVEVADHADPPGIRRPHGEADALDAVDLDQLRAEPLVDLEMRALRQQMHVDVAEDRREAVWIVELDRLGRQLETQAIVGPAPEPDQRRTPVRIAAPARRSQCRRDPAPRPGWRPDGSSAPRTDRACPHAGRAARTGRHGRRAPGP